MIRRDFSGFLPRKGTVFVAMFLSASYLVAGTMDYNDKLAAAEERKATRKEQAPIWSKRCEKKGMDVLATKADKEPWKITCITKRTLKI